MHIPRKIESHLVTWTKTPNRKILLLRGARQVGKTYVVRRHAAAHYKHFLEINFLADKKVASLFAESIDVDEIVEALSAIYGVPLLDHDSLLFFDEIQECPQALQALRFFFEKRPNLNVIASGSLLEFALEEIPSFGVGRIESLFMYPVSFDEYLEAAGELGLLAHLRKAGPNRGGVDQIHEKLKSLFKTFLFLGGLPDVVRRFLETREYQAVHRIIDSLRTGFEDDFAKYRNRVPTARLREVFRSVSLQAGKKFVHTHAYPDANATSVYQAIELLHKAGIVYKIYHSAANGIPLGGEIQIKKFKAMPFDHGIYQRMIGVTAAEILQPDFDPINKGALAEVYAGCALQSQSSPFSPSELYYWHRESKSSNAEVDYVVQVGSQIVPIEVKADTKGKMQSMLRFLAEKSGQDKATKYGIRASLENFGRYENILVVPLYALSQVERIVTEAK